MEDGFEIGVAKPCRCSAKDGKCSATRCPCHKSGLPCGTGCRCTTLLCNVMWHNEVARAKVFGLFHSDAEKARIAKLFESEQK